MAVDDTFKVDGITFKVTSISPNEVQVGAGGGNIAISLDTEGVMNIPSSVKDSEGNSYSVTGIGNSAFSSCEKLTEIKIPNSVTTIDSYAFESCSGITSVTLPDGLKSIGTKCLYTLYQLSQCGNSKGHNKRGIPYFQWMYQSYYCNL